MDAKAKHFDTNGDTPEASRQQTDIEKRRGTKAKQDGCKGVKQRENKRVSREVPPNFGIPCRRSERRTIENARLGTVNEHAPESKLADDFVQGPLRDEPLLKDVAEPVKSCAE